MIVRFALLSCGLALLTSRRVLGISLSDIPQDSPVSKLISTADSNLAAGNSEDALVYFDAAISRDPQNYLNLFKRGTAYLSLGKAVLAQHDFDKVLSIKPDFDGALVQRGKIRARNGEWAGARQDYTAAGNKALSQLATLERAQKAAISAANAKTSGDYRACVTEATTALTVAVNAPQLRKLRAECRFEIGEWMTGVSDLQRSLQQSIEPHLQVSSILFYSLFEMEKGLSQARSCLQSDPDSKPCRKLFKREKEVNKQLKNAQEMMGKKNFQDALAILIGSDQDTGLVKAVKNDFKEFGRQGWIHKKATNLLYRHAVEITFEAFYEANKAKDGQSYCEEVLIWNPTYLYNFLAKAQRFIDNEEYDFAINALNEANQHHPNNHKVQTLRKEAETLRKRSRTKNYYKVLGVDRKADDREIKRAYRKLSLKYHPDKVSQEGTAKVEAEKKMASINEAYEVLSDPELRARFDRGDDPNDPYGNSPFQGSPFGSSQTFVFRHGDFPNGFGGGGFNMKFPL